MGEFSCSLMKKGGEIEGIGPLKKGILSSTGYSVKNSTQKRHKSLNKLVRKEGALKAFRQLNAVAVYTKYSSPRKSKTFKRDRNWVRRKFMRS